MQSASNDDTKDRKPKKVTRYSSICSRHFLPSDFSQSQTRRFLKKSAVPSIEQRRPNCSSRHENQQEDEPVEIELEDPLSSNFCSLCRSVGSTLNVMDDYYFSLIRKCLPLTLNQTFLQKLCAECIRNLNKFSMFIDKVASFQNEIVNPNLNIQAINISSNIKVEPTANFDDEEKLPNIHVIDFTRQSPSINQKILSNTVAPQKKCEILEIVDIKPFHFDGSLQHESYEEEDDIQILSPKLLKVELTDPDEDGSNELEMIRNYVFISTVFLQDHNYVRSSSLKAGEECVKKEHDDDSESFPKNCKPSELFKICNLCNKSFKTFKKFLIHRSHFHPIKQLKHRRKIVNQQKKQKIRMICARIIKKKLQKACKSFKGEEQRQRRRKSYSCPTCHKIFMGPKNLYQHKISHDTSFYSCSLCDKKFKRPHGLKQHVKSIHEKEKTHVCPICNYRYLLKADMAKCRHSKLKKFTTQ